MVDPVKARSGGASDSSLVDAGATAREKAHADQRRRIIQATAELVAKRGYAAVTVELIVKRAHVSYKTFYSHFPNKGAAFVGLYDSFMADVREAINATLADRGASPWPEQVIAVLRTLYELFLAEPLRARAILVEGLTVSREMVVRLERSLAALVPLFRQGREFAPQAAALPDSLETTISGGVFWISYQQLLVGEVDRLEALLPEAVHFALRPYLGEREAARWALAASLSGDSSDRP